MLPETLYRVVLSTGTVHLVEKDTINELEIAVADGDRKVYCVSDIFGADVSIIIAHIVYMNTSTEKIREAEARLYFMLNLEDSSHQSILRKELHTEYVDGEG